MGGGKAGQRRKTVTLPYANNRRTLTLPASEKGRAIDTRRVTWYGSTTDNEAEVRALQPRAQTVAGTISRPWN